MISFVIPAHNEATLLPRTLEAVLSSVSKLGCSFEVIVVNDSSTDQTATVARMKGAKVVDVQHRQIAATRNSGAKVANGDPVKIDDYSKDNRFELFDDTEPYKAIWAGSSCYLRIPLDLRPAKKP